MMQESGWRPSDQQCFNAHNAAAGRTAGFEYEHGIFISWVSKICSLFRPWWDNWVTYSSFAFALLHVRFNARIYSWSLSFPQTF